MKFVAAQFHLLFFCVERVRVHLYRQDCCCNTERVTLISGCKLSALPEPLSSFISLPLVTATHIIQDLMHLRNPLSLHKKFLNWQMVKGESTVLENNYHQCC
jgi:hypothetical protein